MSNYNKLFGSSIGGFIGMVLGLLFIAAFNYFQIPVTPDTADTVNQLALAIGTLLGAAVGTYQAPPNTG